MHECPCNIFLLIECRQKCSLHGFKIDDADTDEKLRLVFEDDDKLALVCETGYSKALCLASMADKDGI